MMKKIDWYIFKKYISTFFFIILIFSLITVIIDLSQKVESFTDPEGPTLGQTIFEYYFNFVPYITSLLLPLYALIAVIFFTSRMAARLEIIAIIGSGVSYFRMLRPYLVAAVLISLFHFAANHYLFPLSNKTRVLYENTYIWTNNFKGKTDNVHINLSDTTKVYVQHFSIKDSTGRNFELTWEKGQERPYRLQAERIQFLKPPNHWRLERYKIFTYEGLDESLVFGGAQHIDTTLNFSPSDFIIRENEKETMTTPELNTYIAERQKKGADTLIYEVEKQRRTADSFTVIILTLIGAAVASRKTRGGMGLHLLVGAITGALYIFTSQFSSTFSIQGGLHPIVGVWIPNLVFLGVAVYFLSRAQK